MREQSTTTLDLNGILDCSGNASVGGNLTVTGNLTISGTTTTVDSTVTTIQDPIMDIGGGTGGAAPGSDDNKDRGIKYQYHNGSAAKVGFFGWDDSATEFIVAHDTAISSEVNTITSYSDVHCSNLILDGNIIKASDGGSTITLDTSDNVTVAGALTSVAAFTVGSDGSGADVYF